MHRYGTVPVVDRITVKYTRVFKWFVVMAFFGLTALGPQNTFAAAAKQARYLQIFDDTDFENAWNKINGASTEHCKVNKIGDIMRCLFKGPIPPTDERQIIAAFENGNFETSETISFTTYMRMMLDLRDQAGTYLLTHTNNHKSHSYSLTLRKRRD